MKVKRGRKGLAVLKLDMEKSYDRMEWRFRLRMLKCFGFDESWIGWVEQYMTTVPSQ